MIKLKNFNIQKQKKSYTCGYSSLSMVSDFFKNRIGEEDFEKELPIGFWGTTPFMFTKLFRKYFQDYNIKLKFIHKKDLVRKVESKLIQGIPVPFIYLAKNKFRKPEQVGHYSVIIGIDIEKSKLFIADPFEGCEVEMDFEEAFSKLSFSNASKDNTFFVYRVAKRIVKLTGYMIFTIDKKYIEIAN